MSSAHLEWPLTPEVDGRWRLLTGIIGAIGGIGGFCLPMLLGFVRHYAGGFGGGFMLLAAAATFVAIVLQALTMRQPAWRLSWRSGLAADA